MPIGRVMRTCDPRNEAQMTDPVTLDGDGPIGEFDEKRAENAVRELLIAVGEDPDREGLRETPARVARAYREIFAGLRQEPEDVLTTTFDLGHDEMVLVKDIEVVSLCEHHLVPFHGVAHVGYIPSASRQDHRPVEAGPAGRRLRPAPPGAGAAHHAGRGLPDARSWSRAGSSSSSSASTCACRCAGSASPARRPSTSAVRGQLRDAGDPRRGDEPDHWRAEVQ